jgi:hypothetical protein
MRRGELHGRQEGWLPPGDRAKCRDPSAGGHLCLGRGCPDLEIEAETAMAPATAVVAVPATAGSEKSHQAGADQQGRNSPFRDHEKYLLVPGEFARERVDTPISCIGRASRISQRRFVGADIPCS